MEMKPADPSIGTPPEFVLQSPGSALWASGCRQPLEAGPAATLAARARTFFAADSAGPQLLVGALPFDPEQDDCLYQPRHVSWPPPATALPPPLRAAVPVAWQVSAEPSASAYRDAVAQAVALMRAEAERDDGLRKVVLSRSLRVHGAGVIDPYYLAGRLNVDPSVTTYLVPLPKTAGADLCEAPVLVGATPELLVSRRGRQVSSHPLAGSARRHRDQQQDQASAQELLASAKDHDEHRMVVEAIVAALAPLCRQLQVPSQPSLYSTASMWHLGTRIEGELFDDGFDVTALAALLHPTPAVCGQPQARARALIAELEPLPRGFYAGAVGWTDAAGDGDWYVAIRCAQLRDGQLRLHAGAGIVAESDPALETEETTAKFRALLDALGLSEQASSFPESSHE